MRILTFTSLFPNAKQPLLGIFIYQRVAHLARRPGVQVHVVAPVPYFPSWLPGPRRALRQIPRQERIGELTVYHPRYFLLPKLSMPLHGWLMFLGSRRLVRQLKKEIQFDCIDGHYIYPDGYAAALLGRRLRVPVILSARGTDVNVFPSFATIRPKIRWCLRQAAGVIAVSGALREAILKLGVPARKVGVIGNGVDAQRFQPMNRQAARRALGLAEGGPVVVSVGTLAPAKGHQLLVAAIASIAARYPELNAYILGEGDYRAELEALVREKQLEGRVFLKGTRPNDELHLWFNAADVSCLASSREGWPNVLLESLACGTPVVGTRVGGIPEVISSPDLGVLVAPTYDAVAAGLEVALNKQWDRDALVRYARGRTWEVVAEEAERFIASRIAATVES